MKVNHTDRERAHSAGTIYAFRGATEPEGNMYSWGTVHTDATTDQPSMSGANTQNMVDGEVFGTELTVGALAHELYHTYGHWAAKTDDPNDPVEKDARTYGVIAERSLLAAVQAAD